MTENNGGFVPPMWMSEIETYFNSHDFLRSLVGLEPDTRTREQKERDLVEWKAETDRIQMTVKAEHAERVARATGLQRRVLQLHAPVFWHSRTASCEGCDDAGYEAEAPDFPCRTYELAQ